MIDLLILLLRPALKAVEGGSKNPFHWLAALIGWPLDIIIAHTSWVLLAGWTKKGEYTISDTLNRLANEPSQDQELYRQIAIRINRESPTGNHIKLK